MTNTKYLHELEPISSYHNEEEQYQMDLAEAIFGTVPDSESEQSRCRNTTTLRGRVFFSAAKAEKIGEGGVLEKKVVLSSPKASYYPFYLENGNTYLNNSTLRGFKRYPVHRNPKSSNLNPDNTEIESVIKPLPKGTVFSGKVYFHNLRKIEIGALLSAITLHGNNHCLFHSIGSGKPLGYGKIKITGLVLNGLEHSIFDYLQAFEDQMIKEKPDYLESDTLKELFAIAKTPSTSANKNLTYPVLELDNAPKNEANEFVNYKKEGLTLLNYSRQNAFHDVKDLQIKKGVHTALQSGEYEFNVTSFQELEMQLKEDCLSCFEDSPSCENLIQALRTIYDRDKKFRKMIIKREFKENPKWYAVISDWIGKDRALAIYQELKQKGGQKTGP